MPAATRPAAALPLTSWNLNLSASVVVTVVVVVNVSVVLRIVVAVVDQCAIRHDDDVVGSLRGQRRALNVNASAYGSPTVSKQNFSAIAYSATNGAW
jgi:hypothetical protein